MTRQISPIFITCFIFFNLQVVVAQAQTDFHVAGSQRRAVEGEPNNNNNRNSSGSQSKSQPKRGQAHDINRQGMLENKLGEECWNNKDWDGAIYHYQQAINHYQSAHEMFPGDDIYKTNLNNNITNLNSAYQNKYYNQGQDLLNRKLNSEAEAAYRKALEYSPNNPNLLNDIGVAVRRQGRYTEAQQLYEEALKIDPNNQYAVRNLKELQDNIFNYTGNKDQVEANTKIIEEELRLQKEKDEKEQQRDKEQKEKEEKEKNIQQINQVNADAKNLIVGGKYKDAEALVREALVLDPDNLKLSFNLALALTLGGGSDGKESEALCRKIILAEPNNADAYVLFGLTFRYEGSPEMAIANFRKSIEIDPKPIAYNFLGNILAEQGAFEEAAVEYRNALKLEPFNTTATESLAKLEKEGKIRNANARKKNGTLTDAGVQLQSSKIQGFDVVIDGKGKYFVGLLPFVVDGSTPYAEKVPLKLAKTPKFQELLKQEGKIREDYAALQARLKEIQTKKTNNPTDKSTLDVQESALKQDMAKKEGEFTMKRFEQTEAIRTFHEEMEEAPAKNSPGGKKQ